MDSLNFQLEGGLTSLNYNSVETLPGFEARAAFTLNSSAVFKKDVDIVPVIIDDTLSWLSSYLVWLGVKFSNAKKVEILINEAAQIGSKKFDFSIE